MLAKIAGGRQLGGILTFADGTPMNVTNPEFPGKAICRWPATSRTLGKEKYGRREQWKKMLPC